jgi:hypothetical protein
MLNSVDLPKARCGYPSMYPLYFSNYPYRKNTSLSENMLPDTEHYVKNLLFKGISFNKDELSQLLPLPSLANVYVKENQQVYFETFRATLLKALARSPFRHSSFFRTSSQWVNPQGSVITAMIFIS